MGKYEDIRCSRCRRRSRETVAEATTTTSHRTSGRDYQQPNIESAQRSKNPNDCTFSIILQEARRRGRDDRVLALKVRDEFGHLPIARDQQATSQHAVEPRALDKKSSRTSAVAHGPLTSPSANDV